MDGDTAFLRDFGELKIAEYHACTFIGHGLIMDGRIASQLMVMLKNTWLQIRLEVNTSDFCDGFCQFIAIFSFLLLITLVFLHWIKNKKNFVT